MWYFDSVSHSRLLRLLQHEPSIDPLAFSIVRQWIKADVWDGHSLKPLRRGIPQGSPISPVLANFFLSSLDLALESSGNHLIRYSDDFLILCPTPQAAAKALADTQSILQAAGLALHPSKTRITSFEEGFRFLGVQFRQNEAMIPWKAKSDSGRLLFLAHPMPHRLLTRYRQAPPPKPASSHNQPSTKTQPAPISHPCDATPNDMPFLYVTQQGAILRKSGDRFLVEHDGLILLDQPYHRLDHILIFGNVQITSQAMAEALDHNIGISLFSHHGRFRGSLIPPPGKNVTLRLAQYAARNDSPRSLSLARATIHAKLTNSQATLLRYENRDRASDQTLDQRRTIQNAIDSLSAASSIPEVAGFEGIAAKSYYEGLMSFNSSPFPWAGRSKHPPTDPLNALLSLSYTLLMQELAALIEALGLDPAIGFLHEIDGARPSLALDLMEPFRAPIADRFVLSSINRAQFQPDDFDSAQNHPATHLKSHSLRRFFEAYELWMLSHPSPSSSSTFRDLLRLEVANFASTLKSNSPWQPFSFAPESETSPPPCNG